MDREQLKKLDKLCAGLEKFKQACIDLECIRSGNESAFEFEEAYPGAIPSPFIININVTKKWLDGKYEVNALNELIDLLYKNVTSETLENILTIRLCQEDEFNPVTYDSLPPPKAA